MHCSKNDRDVIRKGKGNFNSRYVFAAKFKVVGHQVPAQNSLWEHKYIHSYTIYNCQDMKFKGQEFKLWLDNQTHW